jgi:hypothetical protein
LKEETYKNFVSQGKLETVRCAIDAVREFVLSEISQSNLTTRGSLLATYINQLKFDAFIDSKLVVQWIKFDAKNSSSLKLPLPRKWILCIQQNLDWGELRLKQDKSVYYQKLLKLQIRAIVRALWLFFTFNSNRPEMKIFEERSLSVIGHVNNIIESESQTKGHWNYEAWNNKNGMYKSFVNFLPEIQFMKLLFARYFLVERVAGIKGRLRFFARSMRKFFEHDLSISDRCMALEQIFFSELVGLASKAKIPMQIQFTESMGCRRPYWTYEAEKKGGPIEFRFFANHATLSTLSRTEIPPQFSLYTWRKITVVSDWQANSLPKLNALGMKIDVKKTNIPWFVDSDNFEIANSESFILVFDYEGRKGHFGYSSLNDLGLSNPECNIKFLETILEVCSRFDILVYHKKKRLLTKELQLVDYSRIFAKESNRGIYKTIPEGVSAHRIISGANGVISLPPTSTGLIGQQMGVPSIYFDPTGNVLMDDPALEGVPLINSKEGLNAWISSLKSTS